MQSIQLAPNFTEITPHVAILGGRVHVVTAGANVHWRVFTVGGLQLQDITQPTGYFPVTDGRVCYFHDGRSYKHWVGDSYTTMLQHIDFTAGAVGNSPLAVSPGGILLHQDLGAGVYCGSVQVGPWKPTGIMRAREDGSPVMDDDSRRLWPYAEGLCDEDDGVRVSEGWSGIEGEVDGIRFTLWPGRDTMRPRVAVEGELVGITAYGKDGCWLWIGTKAELATLGTQQPPVTLPPLGRTIGIGYFFRDSQQYGDNPTAPGTHSVIADEPRALPAEGGLRMILGSTCLLHEHLANWWDLVDAVYVSAEGDVAQLERDAELARYIMRHRQLTLKPILSYTADMVFTDALTPTDIIGIQAYANAGETPEEFQARLAGGLKWVKHRRVALICQAYDRFNPWWTGPRLEALQVVYWNLARQFSNIDYILLFSDGRRGGTRDYPELRRWHTAMVIANL